MNKENMYIKLKNKHQKEFNEFPIKFAFTTEQFKNGMKELGLKESDTDKIYPIYGGGFIRKLDKHRFENMCDKHYKEIQEEIINDTTGENFIRDMFLEELSNHEYGYTRDIEPTLNALALTINDIEKNENIKRGLELAMNEYNEQLYEDNIQEE